MNEKPYPELDGEQILQGLADFLRVSGLPAAGAAVAAINATGCTLLSDAQRGQLAALSFEERGQLVGACAMAVAEVKRWHWPLAADAVAYVEHLAGAIVLACVQVDLSNPARIPARITADTAHASRAAH